MGNVQNQNQCLTANACCCNEVKYDTARGERKLVKQKKNELSDQMDDLAISSEMEENEDGVLACDLPNVSYVKPRYKNFSATEETWPQGTDRIESAV